MFFICVYVFSLSQSQSLSLSATAHVWSQFLFTMWALEIKLRSSDLEARPLPAKIPHWPRKPHLENNVC